MNVLAIYGNPKRGGFVHGCVEHVAQRLESQGAEVDRLHLIDSGIQDCAGCFTCLRTGVCAIDDDMTQIIDRMRAADGLVFGASVRNSFFPALTKRLMERITYILGFGGDLRGKYVLAIGAVGMATGKRALGKVITLKDFQTHVTDYLFFKTGLPTSNTVEDVAERLDRTADKLHRAIESKAPLPLLPRIRAAIDDFAIRRFMIGRNEDGFYDYVVEQWREQGRLRKATEFRP